MAAIDFPNSPTNGQKFTSAGITWTYQSGVGWTIDSAIVEAGSGFTFVQDSAPLPVNVGDTWFDDSTGATGGTSWVAIEEAPAGEKIWVQFAPGTQNASALLRLPKGVLVYASTITAGPASVRTEIANITFTAEAGRSYKLTAQTLMSTNVTQSRAMLEIHHFNVSTLTQGIQTVLTLGSGNDTTVRAEVIKTFSAGPINLNVTIAPANPGGPAVYATNAPIVPGFFLVEDIGVL